MAAKKCSVVKDDPTGKVGSSQIYESEEDAKAAMAKMADCAGE